MYVCMYLTGHLPDSVHNKFIEQKLHKKAQEKHRGEHVAVCRGADKNVRYRPAQQRQNKEYLLENEPVSMYVCM